MPRHIPDELHVGQKILVRPNPTHQPLSANVINIDVLKGMVHVTFDTVEGRFAVFPVAISNMNGLNLHFKNKKFFFSTKPFFSYHY